MKTKFSSFDRARATTQASIKTASKQLAVRYGARAVKGREGELIIALSGAKALVLGVAEGYNGDYSWPTLVATVVSGRNWEDSTELSVVIAQAEQHMTEAAWAAEQAKSATNITNFLAKVDSILATGEVVLPTRGRFEMYNDEGVKYVGVR